MASMLGGTSAATDLGAGLQGGGDMLAQQLQGILNDQQKKKKKGLSPLNNGMQSFPSAVSDLFNMGGFAKIGGQ